VSGKRTPIAIDDLYLLHHIETPVFSPDGQTIAFVHVRVDRDNNKYRRSIYLVSSAGSRPRRLTSGNTSDSAPCWSPDGRRIAFVSNRLGSKPQLFVIPVDGGEAFQVCDLPQGAASPTWSPDGRRIAFVSASSEAERADPDAKPSDEADPRVYQRLPYRWGTSFSDLRQQHIYVVDVPDDDALVLPKAQRITDGELSFGAPQWLPDGSALVSTLPRSLDDDTRFGREDIVRISLASESLGQITRLTQPGISYYEPRVSPDGAYIAAVCLPDTEITYGTQRLVLIPSAGGETIELTPTLDLNIVGFAWQPQSQTLLFMAPWQGEAAIYTVQVSRDAEIFVPSAGRIIRQFDCAADGSVAFVSEAADSPSNLFVRHADGTEQRLTFFNDSFLAEREILPTETFSYRAPDGETVQGWLIRPAEDTPKPYPLAVYIHGGPHDMWGAGTRTMWHEWQAAAARGYAVFFCNPRGSDGYGARWRDAIHANWGVADAPDIVSGIDAVLTKADIDPYRIAVTGGSYGGYMTAWLIAHEQRFVCAVAARGVYNLITQHSTSDAHELIEYEFDGFPWEIQEKLWQHSPLAHAHNIQTPLRILHSELDFRVPISEAEQLFAFLRRRKQVVELVRYPREGHELTRSGEPIHRADHLQRTLDWFDRYCFPNSSDR
jgi:dipeptidyl aminopeptidase/acylaminoacyl peptidase